MDTEEDFYLFKNVKVNSKIDDKNEINNEKEKILPINDNENAKKKRKSKNQNKENKENKENKKIKINNEENEKLDEESKKEEEKLDEKSIIEEEKEENKIESVKEPLKTNKKNKKKRNKQISFFVGQIPFTCTEDQIRLHFEKYGIKVKDIRMIRKDDGSFKGCCFLHVLESQKEETSKLHHSFLCNRQINVTLDPKSLGLNKNTSSSEIKSTIKKIRNEADKTSKKVMSEKLQEILDKSKGLINSRDIDEKSLTALCSLPEDISERLLKDFSRINFAGIKNINAYLMGMIKKYRTKHFKISK